MLSDSLRMRFYLSIFVASLGLGMYTYFIPVFAQSLGATYFDLGLIGTVGALATAITPGLAGHMADKTNRFSIFSLSLMVSALATFILILSRSVIDIVILRLVGGVGLGIFWPMGEAMASDLAPADKRVREMGRYSVAMAMGILVGPSVGGVIVQILGYFNLFLISSAVIDLSLLQSILWVLPAYSKRNQDAPRSQNSAGNIHIVRGIFPVYMMLMCYGVVWGLLTSIFPGYAHSIGITATLIGFLFSAFGMTRIVSLATAHRYLKFGEKRILIVVSSMIFVGILILAGIPSFTTFLIGMMLIGGGVGVVFPVTINLISRQFSDEKRGTAMGSYETAVNTGETMGPYVAGVIASLTSITSSLMLMSVFALLMILFTVSGAPRVLRNCTLREDFRENINTRWSRKTKYGRLLESSDPRMGIFRKANPILSIRRGNPSHNHHADSIAFCDFDTGFEKLNNISPNVRIRISKRSEGPMTRHIDVEVRRLELVRL